MIRKAIKRRCRTSVEVALDQHAKKAMFMDIWQKHGQALRKAVEWAGDVFGGDE
jgi:hypothetical protein